jgi:hypothetical protein
MRAATATVSRRGRAFSGVAAARVVGDVGRRTWPPAAAVRLPRRNNSARAGARLPWSWWVPLVSDQDFYLQLMRAGRAFRGAQPHGSINPKVVGWRSCEPHYPTLLSLRLWEDEATLNGRSTGLLGRWGFPWGVHRRTVLSLHRNSGAEAKLHNRCIQSHVGWTHQEFRIRDPLHGGEGRRAPPWWSPADAIDSS